MSMQDILKPKSQSEINSAVDNYLSEFEKIYLPNKFIWRQGQKEVVEQIIQTFLQKKYKVVICDIPTGGGKSLCAMAVSYVLNEIGKRGYILTSEISLQDQYEYDIRNYKLPFGSVKGIDNYTCTDNDEKHSLRTCKIRNLAPKSMQCYSECPYFSARDFASSSKTAVLNYSYWLIMQNYANKKRKDEESSASFFPTRDYTICDESHKILDIVQGHYSPRITENTVDKLFKLSDFFLLHKVKDHSLNVNIIKNCIDELKENEDQDILYGHLQSIQKSLASFLSSIEVLKERVDTQFKNKKPPHEWREALYLSDWVKDFHCKIEDYNYTIEQTNVRNLVKNISGSDIVFNCLEESFMMDRYFHKHAGFTVLMSATISDPKQYMKSLNIKQAKYIKMDNLFNYEKSPIYFYPKRKMNYKDMDKNKEWLYSKINEIILNHKDESGIIHSASYDLTMKIRENLSVENRKRVFVYEGTDEKRKVLDMMKSTKGMILMGPSLLEGIDLKDDFARFLIFAKTPFPSLNDRFIKLKMEQNPTWYHWRSVISVIQGMGRPIRNENDWCVSYYLDGCLSDLLHYNRQMFSKEFINRIIVADE